MCLFNLHSAAVYAPHRSPKKTYIASLRHIYNARVYCPAVPVVEHYMIIFENWLQLAYFRNFLAHRLSPTCRTQFSSYNLSQSAFLFLVHSFLKTIRIVLLSPAWLLAFTPPPPVQSSPVHLTSYPIALPLLYLVFPTTACNHHRPVLLQSCLSEMGNLHNPSQVHPSSTVTILA